MTPKNTNAAQAITTARLQLTTTRHRVLALIDHADANNLDHEAVDTLSDALLSLNDAAEHLDTFLHRMNGGRVSPITPA